MRIFIGFTDIANITATYAKGFRALGHEVFSVVWNKSYFYPDSEYDLVIDSSPPGEYREINIWEYVKIFVRLFKLLKGLNCDLFILYSPAVLPNHLYLPLLKILGKKIISCFWGSDIRHWYAFMQEMKRLNIINETAPFIEYVKKRPGGSLIDKYKTIKTAEKYSDLIISQPDYAQLQTRPYMRANVPLDLSSYNFRVSDRKKPLILHAPSVPEAKGTDKIIRVVKELKNEGLDFDFRLINKMSNKELCKLLSESDIVIDDLYSVTIGGLSAEAMASGNVVLVRYLSEFSRISTGCPAININSNNLKKKLRSILLDVELRVSISNCGLEFVKKNNDHIRICEHLLSCLNNHEKLDYDFYPSFYKELTIPGEIVNEEKKGRINNRKIFFRNLFSTGVAISKSKNE